MKNLKLVQKGVDLYVHEKYPIYEICKQLQIDKVVLYKELQKLGYRPVPGLKPEHDVALKFAVDEYINTEEPSLTKIAKKYQLERHSISRRLKNLGIPVINHQNKLKFNNTVFDSIDTEEKAYWLGFIYADGCIASTGNTFELSLKVSDIEHLNKFNKFIEGNSDKVKINKATCKDKEFQRCRISLNDSHFKQRLVSLGCVPKKSLILKFPDINIFKSPDLVKHFIRGYWDGDGCLCYNKTYPSVSIVGTEEVLVNIMHYLPLTKSYKMHYKKGNSITAQVAINGKAAYLVASYLYKNSTIYLDRKYNKYKEYCRLYE